MMVMTEVLFRYPDWQQVAKAYAALVGVFLFVIAVLMAEINYRCIEQPLRIRGRGIAGRFLARRA